ncbi:MAG: NACHT domain-containing protein [Spirulinaceae cyanobacterium]
MEFDQALEQTQTLALTRQGYALSAVDKLILQGTWSGLTYDEMANTSDYSLNYLMRDVAPRLWKLLSKVYGERVSKSNYRAVCDRYSDPDAETPPSAPVPSPASRPSPARPLEQPDWGDAPDVPDSGFFGREAELAELTGWLKGTDGDRCRLVTLWGLPGIGKTSLARRLADQVKGEEKDEFEFVVWRSLRHKPLLQDLAQDVLPRLGVEWVPGQEIAQFIEVFQQSRCLIVLDGLESLLRNNDPWRRYEPDYDNYGTLFQRLAEIPHQSCLLLTCQEKPRELNLLEYPSQPVQLKELKGLAPKTATVFAEAYGLKDPETWQDLFERYAGHPIVLKQIATLSRDIFGGQVKELLEMSMLLPEGNFQVVWKRLTPDEQRFLTQISTEKSESLGVITAVSAFNETKSEDATLTTEAVQVIESLKARSLIEITTEPTERNTVKTRLNLSGLIKKFITLNAKP